MVADMKIHHNDLWDSLNRVYDKDCLKDMRDYGYVIPEALKDCAVTMVRDGRDFNHPKYNPNQHALDEQNIIDALRELRDNGFLTFEKEQVKHV